MRSAFSLLSVPLLAQQSVDLRSVEKERAIGRQYASEIMRQTETLAVPAIDAYVKRIGAVFAAQLRQAPFEYQFEVIAGGYRTEPIPLPGGYVLIPVRSLAEAKDEAEFAGMLAHSVAHVALRHGTRTSMAGAPPIFMGGWMGSHAETQGAQTPLPVSFLESQRTGNSKQIG
jgi:predicted Zn-dependent protease